MIRLYLTRLKCLLRNKENIFWTFLFPVVLATLFNLAFQNLYSSESFESIPIAVINNDGYANMEEFQDALEGATTSSEENGSKLFMVTESDDQEAKALLDENDIIGYIVPGEEMQLTVKGSGIEQTIVKSFLDSYSQITNTVASILTANPASYPELMNDISNRSTYVNEIPIGNNPPDVTLNYYYALLAMATLFGSFWGLKEITDIQENLSYKGTRINIAPVHKMKLLLSNMLAALTIHFTGILLLLGYLLFALKIDFGNDIWSVILICFVSCMLGIALGTMVSSITKKSADFKNSVLSGGIMFSCFLSGLMMVEMKHIVSTKMPFLQYINPAHIITDAFYSLYYYETYNRFYMNIGLMIGYILLFSLITYFATRRRQYASI